ncbi:MAG: peptidoglycan DD-metalloendopeptidase family protein [Bacteroidetes bacterium]|nr:peptidoglycan DD-metalloendopeptidase family protein [Bacteroidota bacterium]MBU1579053.1 peptidoglycan DD-metalloendopeptidase family protein [Bacteroidota bacterium]MBU2465998.1 peptidoglycan DD-metalloendopeptidase family protein [Bacteroidota bacterium]MBU2557369.1 peptidoglycan DD-metalloendopeptidase family protein [Bacteroidota bacterium]
MRIFSFCVIILLPLFALLPMPVEAQDVNTLEQDKKRIEEEIAYSNKILEETTQNKELTLDQLMVLRAKISKRANLLATIQKQLMHVESRISKSSREIERLQNELVALNREYAKMIQIAYRNRGSYNKLIFLFSAEDFNQAFQRMKYLQQYAAFRRAQIERIETTTEKLNKELNTLDQERNKQKSLLEAERREHIALQTEQQSVDQSVKKLSRKEQQLQKTIRDKEREAQKLQRTIEAIIAEEVRRAKLDKTDKVPREDRLLELTPEELNLSNAFAGNKGRLPWPTERGIIDSRFGNQPHPVLKKVTIKNNGIDIATQKGAQARAVFDGIVVSTNSISAANNAVIVRHGDYFTVYSNLEEVYVKRGDKVKTKDLIGRIHTDKSSAKTSIHFELWKGRQIVDPASWLAR